MNKKIPVNAIVLLVGFYVAFQLVADVTATKQVNLLGLSLPGGTLVFAITFTWRDLIHKKLGKEWARAAIWIAAFANLFMALYFALTIAMPSAVWWEGQAAFASTLGIVWRITLASIVAEVVSELIDTEVYAKLAPRFTGASQAIRVLGSNAVSLPVDSVVFALLAFGGVLPANAIWHIIVGQVAFKAIVTVVSLPLIYTVKEEKLSGLGEGELAVHPTK